MDFALMDRAQSVVAVLDDEPRMRKALGRLLATHGFRVAEYSCGRDFLATLPACPVDCLVLDLHMPEVSGFEVLEALAERHAATPVVVITGHDEPGLEERARALGASAFLAKPVDETVLLSAIRSVMAAPHSLTA